MAKATSRARGKAVEAFIEREFELVHAEGKSILRLRVFQPIRMPGGEYGCAYEIRLGRKTVCKPRLYYGVDGLQAMLLALRLVDQDLDRVLRGVPGGKIAAWERRDLRLLRYDAEGGRPTRARARRRAAK